MYCLIRIKVGNRVRGRTPLSRLFTLIIMGKFDLNNVKLELRDAYRNLTSR